MISPDKFPAADLSSYTVQSGDTLSQIAQDNGVSVNDLIGLNPQLADATGGQTMNPDVLFPGQEITLPPAAGADVYAGGVGTSAGTQADIASGQIPDSEISRRLTGVSPAGDAAPTTSAAPAPASAPTTTGSSNTFTGTMIANEPVVPGQPLSARQVAIVDMARSMGNSYSPEVMQSYNLAKGIKENSQIVAKIRESVQHKILTFEQLIDQKRTEMFWTLNESVGRKNNSFVLTTAGTYAVFENVERYRRAMLEVAGVPGSTRPAQYRPDAPDAATPAPAAKNSGLLSRGLSRVGGALSTFGRQFTTNVTKEKLKMNWHQKGKPSDSDQLAAWLVTQGVPQDVVSSIYKKMGLPVAAAKPAANTAPAKKAAAPKSTSPGGAGAVGAMTKSLQQPEKSSTGGTTAQTATGLRHTASAQNPNATPAQPTAAAAGTKPGAQPASYNAANVMKLPGMEKYAKASPAVAPRAANFSGPSGYGQTTTGFKAPGAARTPAVAAAVPKTSRATAQGRAPTKTPTQAEKDAYVRSIGAPALPEADQEKVGNMDADRFDAAMARLKQLAGAGPLKTVYDPAKRVYRNVPTAVQPQTQPKKS
jgi:LysM repeat protein